MQLHKLKSLQTNKRYIQTGEKLINLQIDRDHKQLFVVFYIHTYKISIGVMIRIMNQNYKILLIEDDGVICQEIHNYLVSWGYEVKTIKDFNHVIEEFEEFLPHLVLLDITLPFYNGFYWCSEIRKRSKVPVVFVSSANDNMNIVMAVNMGGDDFIAKPFDLQVLSAKIQAMLRRTYSFVGETKVLSYHDILLNLNSMQLEYKAEKIELTKNEFRILEMLFLNPGEVVDREAIIKRLWEEECFIDDNTLAVNMTRLRKKLSEQKVPDIIYTKKGVGYYLSGDHV